MTEPGSVVSRLEERFETLAQISGPGPGVTRLAYTELERDAHAQFAAWAEAGGARVEHDAAGNTWAVVRDGEPYFLVGSHLDIPAQQRQRRGGILRRGCSGILHAHASDPTTGGPL